MGFDKRTLVLPQSTVFEEHLVVAKGDVILGNHVKFGFGIKTDGRAFLGQGAELQGDLACTGDLRCDTSSHILGGVKVGAAGYLGERCYVKGDLEVEGDLDVGDDVRVGGRLQAKGWVNKRNPVPLVLYIFIYMLELMRLGHSAEVERILKELEEADSVDIAVGDVFLFIPDNSKIGLTHSDIHGNLDAGTDVRILGNLVVRGDAKLGSGVRLFGALRCDGDVVMGPGSQIQGQLVAAGAVTVGEGCQILGELHARTVTMFPSATVDGKIVATEGVSFRTEVQIKAQATAEAKVDAFTNQKADLADLLG